MRTRRGAANLSLLGALLTLAATAVAAWARLGSRGAYARTYQWINLPTATSGPTQFQGFGIDISLTIDHAGLAALVAVLTIAIGAAVWLRRGGRGEPGYVRNYVVLSLLVLGAVGVCVSGDLAELAAFWGVTAVATYLGLSQRWGVTDSTGPARWALAVPMVADVALVLAIGIVYSRYGQLTLSALPPVLHTIPGWGLKSLTAAAGLILVAAAGRGALFPLQGWLTWTRDAPACGQALAQGVWPVLSALLIYRTLPLFHGAGPQALMALGVVGVVAGIVLPLRALAGNDVRDALFGAGAGQLGLVLVVFAKGAAVVALTAALAGGLARGAALLAAGGLIAAMRTTDLSSMGDAMRRMPLSALALALA
ncbi:MAG: proton-conducting transporter membrane subunit, partial [Candidatus Dormibacteraceae bacterium]